MIAFLMLCKAYEGLWHMILDYDPTNINLGRSCKILYNIVSSYKIVPFVKIIKWKSQWYLHIEGFTNFNSKYHGFFTIRVIRDTYVPFQTPDVILKGNYYNGKRDGKWSINCVRSIDMDIQFDKGRFKETINIRDGNIKKQISMYPVYEDSLECPIWYTRDHEKITISRNDGEIIFIVNGEKWYRITNNVLFCSIFHDTPLEPLSSRGRVEEI